MSQKIIIYGHGGGSAFGLQSDEDLIRFIEKGVVERGNRYRYTLRRDADVIVLSRKGRAFGHFEILARQDPDEMDTNNFPTTKSVYVVGKRAIYRRPVPLSQLDIETNKIRFGCIITPSVFNEIKERGGVCELV